MPAAHDIARRSALALMTAAVFLLAGCAGLGTVQRAALPDTGVAVDGNGGERTARGGLPAGFALVPVAFGDDVFPGARRAAVGRGVNPSRSASPPAQARQAAARAVAEGSASRLRNERAGAALATAAGAATLVAPAPSHAVAAQAGIALRPASPDDFLTATLQRVLETTEFGHLAFNAPAAMALEKRALIRVILGPGADGAPRHVSDAGGTRAAQRMSARLSGRTFEIESVTAELQTISPSQPTEWLWLVTPKQSGSQLLHLALSGVASMDGASATRTFPTLDHAVQVEVRWRDRLRGFWASNWQWISAVVVAALAAAAWVRARSRKRRRWFRGGL